MMFTKTLTLAAATAVTIGTGAAMAQTEVPPASEGFYQWHEVAPAVIHGQVQAGSSDLRSGYPAGNYVPFNGDYSTLANPG